MTHDNGAYDKAEHVNSPDPAGMVRDLQRALYGVTYATAHSPADEWQRLLGAVASISDRVDPEVLIMSSVPTSRTLSVNCLLGMAQRTTTRGRDMSGHLTTY